LFVFFFQMGGMGAKGGERERTSHKLSGLTM